MQYYTDSVYANMANLDRVSMPYTMYGAAVRHALIGRQAAHTKQASHTRPVRWRSKREAGGRE
jgi:hypothetical protein